VAESSLDFDRTRKGSLYARAGIPDYWIVNLPERVLETYRGAEADAAAVFGWRYALVARLTPPATIAPLAFPAARLAVADVLP